MQSLLHVNFLKMTLISSQKLQEFCVSKGAYFCTGVSLYDFALREALSLYGNEGCPHMGAMAPATHPLPPSLQYIHEGFPHFMEQILWLVIVYVPDRI